MHKELDYPIHLEQAMEALIPKLVQDSVNSCLLPSSNKWLLYKHTSLFRANNNKQVPSDIACSSINTSLHFNSKYGAEEAPTTWPEPGPPPSASTPPVLIISTLPPPKASAVCSTTTITPKDLVPTINRTTPLPTWSLQTKT